MGSTEVFDDDGKTMASGTGGSLVGDIKLGELLALTHRFGGWITAETAGLWMWPTSPSRTKSAERLIRRAVSRSLLYKHPINQRTHVYLLTSAGVDHIDATGTGDQTEVPSPWLSKIKNAKKKGRKWNLPQQFDHHRRAIKFLGFFKAHHPHAELFTDSELSRWNTRTAKRPDAIAIVGQLVIWLEVEGARKTGKERKKLAETVVRILWRQPPVLSSPQGEIKANKVIFALPEKGRDTRKTALNHETRISNMLAPYEIPAAKRSYYLAKENAQPCSDGRHVFSLEEVALDPLAPGRIDRVWGLRYPTP